MTFATQKTNIRATESPLAIKTPTEFTRIEFGAVAAASPVVQLRFKLDSLLRESVTAQPPSFDREINDLLDVYAGRPRDFFSLFYAPAWSFLHWTLAEQPDGSAKLKRSATTAHALALFLHLWDDHLCDGQLAVDLPRLQMRTAAWQRFVNEATELAELVGLPRRIVDEHAERYLTSLYLPVGVSDLDEYLELFSRQVSTWLLVPRLLDSWDRMNDYENSLQRLIDLFARCWRLVDDLQDLHLDLATGKRNAVWFALDATGRDRWHACSAEVGKQLSLDSANWKALSQSIHESGCLTEVLGRVELMLAAAARIADHRGWVGLACELHQSKVGNRS